MELSKETREIIKICVVCVSIISTAAWFWMGCLDSLTARGEGRNGCVYHSLASVANPGYVGACELFRKRFDLP